MEPTMLSTSMRYFTVAVRRAGPKTVTALGSIIQPENPFSEAESKVPMGGGFPVTYSFAPTQVSIGVGGISLLLTSVVRPPPIGLSQLIRVRAPEISSK